MTDQHGRQQQGERLRQVMRAFAAAQSELGRLFARDQHMHTTDATAIVEILNAEERGRPLSPARLAERLSLTTGATSTLLNRLEGAGHVLRHRGHSDRRVVTLHSTPAIHAAADAYFAPAAERIDAAMSTYTPADIDLVIDVVDRLHSTLSDYTATLVT